MSDKCPKLEGGAPDKMENTATELEELEIVDNPSSSTINLLQNLTEIELVKKDATPQTSNYGVYGTTPRLCYIPNIAQNIYDVLINAKKYVATICKDAKVYGCIQCCLVRKCKFSVTAKNKVFHICDDTCLKAYKQVMGGRLEFFGFRLTENTPSTSIQRNSAKFILGKLCEQCQNIVPGLECNLIWETYEFCDEVCLGQYQNAIGTTCTFCHADVFQMSIGKYCVRFGYTIKQFCSNICLVEYKKDLKLCMYCQKDISKEDSFLVQMRDKTQKEFCTKICMEKYDAMCNQQIYPIDGISKNCAVCTADKQVIIEYNNESNNVSSFCSERCFVAYKFVNNVAPGQCITCRKYFDTEIFHNNSAMLDGVYHRFCSQSCLLIHVITYKKVDCCSWCKVKKYNVDMIIRSCGNDTIVKMCSLNCLNLYNLSQNQSNLQRINCCYCHKDAHALYNLKMTDGSVSNFCSYTCMVAFQNKYSVTIELPTAVFQKMKAPATEIKATSQVEEPTIPIITNVQSLAIDGKPPKKSRTKKVKRNLNMSSPLPPIVETRIKHQFIIKTAMPPPQRNIATMCKIITATKEVTCIPESKSIEIQTDDVPEKTSFVTMPVPVYVPAPAWMYSTPYPVAVPFQLPLPIPVFIPTTKNSGDALMKEIEKIQIETPTNPFEAELLTIAEMVAADKKDDTSCVEMEEGISSEPAEESSLPVVPVVFGDDAVGILEPGIVEGALTGSTGMDFSHGTGEDEEVSGESLVIEEEVDLAKGYKRVTRSSKKAKKRSYKTSSKKSLSSASSSQLPVSLPAEPLNKPDANMCLKFNFGVNAWKQWVALKNAEMEHSFQHTKLLKSELLQLTADELNYSLCLFVKEVRKPNGQEYAPDTIYYLCLGIQQYLLANARIENIFCDAYYEKFTDCLDEIAKKFSVLYNDSHYIVTRVEEEHLWESKQLGAHSPNVLLGTLMFFNTKHFNLSTVDDHMQLSFSHIMKHWKRNQGQLGVNASGSRNVLLRFYPLQSSAGAAGGKNKVYEQQENEINPLRCPVKLYEFYLTKCPESVKTRNDVFYLLPERSCVPDSPVWYSATALPRGAVEKILHRVKMVKEVNVALLTSST